MPVPVKNAATGFFIKLTFCELNVNVKVDLKVD